MKTQSEYPEVFSPGFLPCRCTAAGLASADTPLCEVPHATARDCLPGSVQTLRSSGDLPQRHLCLP